MPGPPLCVESNGCTNQNATVTIQTLRSQEDRRQAQQQYDQLQSKQRIGVHHQGEPNLEQGVTFVEFMLNCHKGMFYWSR